MRKEGENSFLLAALAVAGLLLARRGDTPRPAPIPNRETPVQAAPPQGWWAILKRVGAEVSENQLMTQAAAITFYGLLSMFPAMAAMVALYGLVADPANIVHQVDSLTGVLPDGGMSLLTDELKSLTAASDKGLGWAVILGILTSLWTSNQAMKALFNALNAVHGVKEARGFIKLTALTLACTAGLIVFMLLAMGAIVIVPAVVSFVGLGDALNAVVNLARWPLLLVAISLLLAVLFRFGPCRTKVVWRWITWGSAFAAVAWVIVSALFSWYVAHFGSYNKTYGSLGAVVGFMTWLWISGTVVLIGAQLDAELEKATVGKQRSRRSENEAPAVVAARAPA